ncbi:hypothetical protein EVAR_20788_1 [Eumeta japonica]|uniref:Uncharacterized protein n=1 Tax=Eumeta variegata TaxID=151549 RepID=A0A4C1UEV7_EUMVA|nr:hypothetical protein EVAR_20788_1 [Eumeta japonica]
MSNLNANNADKTLCQLNPALSGAVIVGSRRAVRVPRAARADGGPSHPLFYCSFDAHSGLLNYYRRGRDSHWVGPLPYRESPLVEGGPNSTSWKFRGQLYWLDVHRLKRTND